MTRTSWKIFNDLQRREVGIFLELHNSQMLLDEATPTQFQRSSHPLLSSFINVLAAISFGIEILLEQNLQSILECLVCWSLPHALTTFHILKPSLLLLHTWGASYDIWEKCYKISGKIYMYQKLKNIFSIRHGLLESEKSSQYLLIAQLTCHKHWLWHFSPVTDPHI